MEGGTEREMFLPATIGFADTVYTNSCVTFGFSTLSKANTRAYKRKCEKINKYSSAKKRTDSAYANKSNDNHKTLKSNQKVKKKKNNNNKTNFRYEKQSK